MSRSSLITAIKLQSAGFPQPIHTPAAGQVWYNAINASPYHITASEGDRCDYVAGGVLYIDRYLNEGEVFAPTAEDILAELGEGWSLSPVKTEDKTFWCVTFMEDGFVQNHQWHEIATEACAAAYLNLHAPK